jgi:hypothetical protein
VPRKDWIKCDKFNGNTSWEIFLFKFQQCATYNGWSEADKLFQLQASLEGRAAQILLSCTSTTLGFSDMVAKLQAQFGTAEQSSLYENQLKARRRGRNETLQDYFLDISRLMVLAYPGPPSELLGKLGVNAFVDGLDDESLEIRVRDRFPKDLESAFRIALQLESNQRYRRNNHNVHDRGQDRTRPWRNNNAVSTARNDDSVVRSLADRLKQVEATTANHQQESDRVRQLETKLAETEHRLKLEVDSKNRLPPPRERTDDARPQPRPVNQERQGGKCFHCGEFGHMARLCPEKRELNGNRPGGDNKRNGAPTCTYCGWRGHLIEACRRRQRGEGPGPNGQTQNQAWANGIAKNINTTQTTDKSQEGFQTCLEMKLNGHLRDFLLDSGCEASLVPARFVKS